MSKDNKVRREMNQRFIEAYTALVQRGEIMKSQKGKSLSDFAEKIFGKRGHGHLMKKYLEGERLAAVQMMMRLHDCYPQFNKAYLLMGKGSLEGNGEEQGSARSDSRFQGNIVFNPNPVYASGALGIDSYEGHERFSLPGLTGEYVAFTVSGNSMSPTLHEGDLVICKRVEAQERIQDNEIYAVLADGSLMVKRLQRIERNRVLSKYKCISDNYLEHDPFELEVGSISALFRVVRKVTQV